MASFFSVLENRALQIDSLLCIGLDPYPADLPAPTAEAAKEFCLRLIEMTAPLAVAFKPNAAFFEALGPDGWKALQDVISAIPAGIPVILDAKRGDIASTAEAYANSTFNNLGASAITLSPYLGYDSLQPYLTNSAFGAFLLCKTSNPGSIDLQDLPLGGDYANLCLYEQVASLGEVWNTADNLGLIVGATFPEALRRVRRVAPNLWILAPGIGAQGGDLAAALQAGLRDDGLGMLISVSRGIARSTNPHQAANELLANLRRERAAWQQAHLQQLARAKTGPTQPKVSAVLAEGLFKTGCVRFGKFTLKSGLESPIYIDLRQLISYPSLLSEVAEAYLPLLRDLQFDRLAALPYAALPIATAISLKSGWPVIYPRKEIKSYGTKSEIEGVYLSGERVAVIDDLATTGGSKFEAITKLTEAGLTVRDVIVLIDRQSGADESLAAAGFHLHSVVNLTQLLDYWENTGLVSLDQIATTRAFLAKN